MSRVVLPARVVGLYCLEGLRVGVAIDEFHWPVRQHLAAELL